MDAILSRFKHLAETYLLVLAHLASLIAILLFRHRTGDAPLSSVGFPVYSAGVALSLAAGLYLWLRRSQTATGPALFAILWPPFTAFLFWASLGGRFGPYDMRDGEAMRFSFYTFAILFLLLALTYRSWLVWGFSLAAQLIVYLDVYGIPNYIHYPTAGLFSIHGDALTRSLALHLLAGLGILLLRKMAPRFRPGLWLASAWAGLIAGWFFLMIWGVIPRNGAYVGWVETGLYVPEAAWDLFRLLAELLAGGALLSAAVRLVEGFSRATGKDQNPPIDWSQPS